MGCAGSSGGGDSVDEEEEEEEEEEEDEHASAQLDTMALDLVDRVDATTRCASLSREADDRDCVALLVAMDVE
jgi:hypothetical protein